MTIQTKTVLKSYFETNDTPSQSNFVDLIDTMAALDSDDWKDYSTGSSVNGWSSFTNKDVWYRAIEDIIFVQFDFQGTSNDTVVNFTVPFTQQSNVDLYGITRGLDNAGSGHIGVSILGASATVVNCYVSGALGAWTNTGVKKCAGQFWYKKA